MAERKHTSRENEGMAREYRANIFDPNYARVLRFLFRMTGSVEQAQDLTQEVFIKAHEHQGRLVPEKTDKWLLQVGYTTAIDDIRRDRRRIAATVDNDKVDLSKVRDNSRSVNPVDTVLRVEQQEEIRVALERLRPDFREALVHYYWGDLSYGEISAVMGKPLNTVKSMIYRGKTNLKKELTKLDI